MPGVLNPGVREVMVGMVLQRLLSAEPWGWLRESSERYRGTVAGLVSDRFPSCCKIFLPYIEDLRPPDLIAYHYRDYKPGGPYRIDPEYESAIRRLAYGASDAPFPYRNVAVTELARRFGLQIVPELSVHSLPYPLPRGLWAPSEGVLPEPLADHVIERLQAFTGGQSCEYFWSIWPPEERDYGAPKVYRGALHDATSLTDVASPGPENRVPEYWWPEDRSWALCTAPDLTFTVVGGSAELIGVLLSDAALETIAVGPDTGVWANADVVNRR
jgi:hypothetical protein